MSVLNTLPTPVVQMGLVEKIVDAQQNQPHVQQLAARQVVSEQLKRQDEQVAEVVANTHGRKVRDRQDERERESPDGAASKGPKKEAQGNDADEQRDAAQPESQPGNANPWAGNILNIKV